jgi:predicted GTPase
MGYSEEQLKDMETTINRTDCDTVVVATPIDLRRLIDIKKPNTRVYYELQEIGVPNFGDILSDFGKAHNLPMK